MPFSDSQIAKVNLGTTLCLGIFMGVLAVKSCNESANLSEQMEMNRKLITIDSVNQISLTNLRNINLSVDSSLTYLVGLNQRTDSSIGKLTTLNDKGQRQIGQLYLAIQRLRSIDSISQKQFKDEHILFKSIVERDSVDFILDSLSYVVSSSKLQTTIDGVRDDIGFLGNDRSQFTIIAQIKLFNDYLDRIRQVLLGMTTNRYLARQPIILNNIAVYLQAIDDIDEMFHNDDSTIKEAYRILNDALYLSKIVISNDPYWKDSVRHVFSRAIHAAKNHR